MVDIVSHYVASHILRLAEDPHAARLLFEDCSTKSWSITDINCTTGSSKTQWSSFVIGCILKARKSISTISLEEEGVDKKPWQKFATLPTFTYQDFQKVVECVPKTRISEVDEKELWLATFEKTKKMSTKVVNFVVSCCQTSHNSSNPYSVIFSGSSFRSPISRQNLTSVLSSFLIDVIKSKSEKFSKTKLDSGEWINSPWSQMDPEISIEMVIKRVLIPLEIYAASSGSYSFDELVRLCHHSFGKFIHFDSKLLDRVSRPDTKYIHTGRPLALIIILHWLLESCDENSWITPKCLSTPASNQHSLKDHFQMRILPCKRPYNQITSPTNVVATKRQKISVNDVTRNKTRTSN